MEDTTTTYPLDATRRLAEQLMDEDWSLTVAEAMEKARDIVIDVTIAVDKLRAIEAEEA